MLSWRILQAVQLAHEAICMGEQAAEHYGYTYTRWYKWTDWWRGFAAGWVDGADGYTDVSVPMLRRWGTSLFDK